MSATSPVKRILLVDDDRDFVESNQAVLESEGYQVITAFNGAEGLQKAKAERPDLMIVDVMMATQTEGFELSRQLHQTPELKGAPIILVTGIRRVMNLPFSFEPDATELPVDSVLEKPVPPSKLLDEVKKRLRLR